MDQEFKNFLYLFNADIICHQLKVLLTMLLSLSNVSMLPKPSRPSFFSASIHKQSPIPFLVSWNTMDPSVNIFYGFVKWICATNDPMNPPASIKKSGAVHQEGHDLKQALHLKLHMLLCAILPLDTSPYFIRPTLPLQITILSRCLCTYRKKGILCYFLQPEKYTL